MTKESVRMSIKIGKREKNTKERVKTLAVIETLTKIMIGIV
jgi:hypothetical protein